MRQFNLNAAVETFVVFDAIAGTVSVAAFLLAIACFVSGNFWFWIGAVLFTGSLLIVYGAFIAPHRIQVTTFKQSLVSNPISWSRLVLISDIHAGSWQTKKTIAKIADQLSKLEPDILVFCGDFVICNSDDISLTESIVKIKSVCGNYFVLGNHDYLDNPQAICDQLTAWGCKDITNSSLTIRVHGTEIRLAGIDDVDFGTPRLLSKILNDQAPHITLAHNPDAAMDMHQGQTDLLLCGHTHGGQIRLPIIGSLFVPSHLGRRADQGLKKINGIPTIISKGLGQVGIHVRFFCRPEIVVVELGI